MRFVILFLTFVFAQPALAVDLEPWQEKALALVAAEKSVINVKWHRPQQNVLWLSMKPDGSDRSGFAQYVCLLFPDADAPTGILKTIWIYDPSTYDAGDGKAMGMAACR